MSKIFLCILLFLFLTFRADAMKILEVDDSKVMRKIVIRILATNGYQDVVEANNGLDGLSRLAEAKVDLVMTDLNMPVIDGLEFIKRIRNDDPDLPILAVATSGERELVAEALRAGANAYIIKPFNPQTLKAKIDLLMSSGNRTSERNRTIQKLRIKHCK